MAISSLDRAQLVPPPSPTVRPLVLWALRLAALAAAVVSGYLAWISFAGANALGCGSGFDCDEVLESGWSAWFGLPVALPAVSLYLSLVVALAFSGLLSPENVRRRAWAASLALSLLAGAAALWFIGLQAFVVGKYCSWCLTVHLCGLGAAALALMGMRSGNASWRVPVAVALCGVVALALGQVFGPQPTGKLERLASLDHLAPNRESGGLRVAQPLTVNDLYKRPPPTPGDTRIAAEVSLPEPIADDAAPLPLSLDDLELPPTETPTELSDTPVEVAPAIRGRVVSVFRGAAQIDMAQHPVLGGQDAPFVVVKLFDYTCHHCRQMHQHLHAARREFNGKLAIVMCPVPLNRQCNPQMQFDNPKHAEACELARLALAVWQADPEQFEEFDAWLFAPPAPPSAANARAKAVELVGESKLVAQLYGDTLRERLAVGPKLYQLVGAGTVPKLLLPTGMLVGPGQSTEAVLLELKREFAQRPEIP